MNQTYASYEVFKAIHEARRQSARAAAVASGVSRRHRRRRFDDVVRSLRPGTRQPEGAFQRPSVESLFWA